MKGSDEVYVGESIGSWRQNRNSKGGEEEDEDEHVTTRLCHIHS